MGLVGIKTPFTFTNKGYPTPAKGDDVFGSSILMILSTSVGERIHRPTFGSYLNRLIFEPINGATAARASVEIRRAISTWDQRIQITDIKFTNKPSTVIIEIKWLANNSIQGTTSIPVQITNTVA